MNGEKQIPNEFGKLRACSKCIHVKTCGAYRAFSEVLNEMESKYDFIKKPFQAESLAMTCQEYSPISLENGIVKVDSEVVN